MDVRKGNSVLKLTIIVALLLCSFHCIADGLLMSIGTSPPIDSRYSDNKAYRISYVLPLTTELEFLQENHISVDVEISYMRWQDNSPRWRGIDKSWFDDIQGLSITPMFKYQRASISTSLKLHIAAGIGLSYHDDINLAFRELGTRCV